jgi:hypothetical protein
LTVLKQIVLGVAFTYIVSMFTLGTWPFAESPGSFWVFLAAILVIFITSELFGILTSWTPKIVLFYAVACIFIAGWQTLGGSFTGSAFDPLTGEPKYMVDPTTGRNDPLGRSPAECRGDGLRHDVFDYKNFGICFSAETGQRLVPLTSETATGRNPLTWLGTFSDYISQVSMPKGSLFKGSDCSNDSVVLMQDTSPRVTVKLCADGGPVTIQRAGGKPFAFERLNAYIQTPSGIQDTQGLCWLRVHRNMVDYVSSDCTLPPNQVFGVDAFQIQVQPRPEMGSIRGYQELVLVIEERQ